MTALPEKLLPCPFCGGEAIMEEYDDGNGPCHRPECSKCSANVGTYAMKPVSIYDWNRRTPDSRLLAAQEALRPLIDNLDRDWQRLMSVDGYAPTSMRLVVDAFRALTAPGDDARREAEEGVGVLMRYAVSVDKRGRSVETVFQSGAIAEAFAYAIGRLTGKPEGDDQ